MFGGKFFCAGGFGVSRLALSCTLTSLLLWSPSLAAQEGAGAEFRHGDIIVTGSKRDTTILETPASISVFNESLISAAKIERPTDFLQMIPNVTFFEDNAAEAAISIRGQGAARTADQNVAFIVDGVQLTSVKLFNNELGDIRQIEVFKGPQTALYGRNAGAGAIVVTSRAPSDTLEGEVSFGYGNWNTAKGAFALSGPISDTLKFRVSGGIKTTDGPYEARNTGEDVRRWREIAGKLHLQYTPTDQLEVNLRASMVNGKGGGVAYNAQFAGLPIGGVPVPALNANQANLPFVSNIIGSSDKKIFDSSLKIDYDLGFATLTSVTAYSDMKYLAYAGDLIPYILDTPSPPGVAGTQSAYHEERAFSQEVRLTSSGNQRFRWMLGAYYLNLKHNYTTILSADLNGTAISAKNGLQLPGSANPTITIADSLYRTKDYSVFANAQLDIIDNLELSVAGRYDVEKKSIKELAPDMINTLTGTNYNLCVEAFAVSADQCIDRQTFKKFVPKVSLTYKADIGSIYASYGKGFKSGGFNPIGTRAQIIRATQEAGFPIDNIYLTDSFKEELSESYEAGVKLRLLDGGLTFNAAGYITNVSNAQQFVFFPTGGIVGLESIDKIRLKGFEFDFQATLPGAIQLFGSYGYVDGKIRAYAPNPSYVGNRSPLASKYTATIGASREFELGPELTFTPRVEYQRFGSIYWDPANTPGTRRSPIGLLNARAVLAGQNWEAGIWSKNLTNKRYNAEIVPLIGVLAVMYKGDSRSFGADVKMKF